MTIYRPPNRPTYRYDFEFEGQRYWGSTKQTRKDDAALFESQLKRRLRQQAGDVPVLPGQTPHLQDWAEIYFAHASRTLQRPERAQELLNVVLRFWGRRPRTASVPGAPYHDLRLEDPIRQPEWIERFERWIADRGVGPQTRNHYRGILSRLYRCALLPQFRSAAGVGLNPFVGVPRDKTVGRSVTLSPTQLRAWMAAAPAHTRLAMQIAALAPKLRLANILALRWSKHFDAELQFLTIAGKTTLDTGDELVVPISPALRALLKAARAEHPRSNAVIVYRGYPVTHIRTGLQSAAAAAGIVYGRDVEGGATFHTIRHSLATLLAELELPPRERKAVMGHKRDETTARYTHLRPVSQVAAHRQIARRLQLATGGKVRGTLPDKVRLGDTGLGVPPIRRTPAR